MPPISDTHTESTRYAECGDEEPFRFSACWPGTRLLLLLDGLGSGNQREVGTCKVPVRLEGGREGRGGERRGGEMRGGEMRDLRWGGWID